MTIALILAYIANVFLNRWLNKIAYKRGDANIEFLYWFVPIATTMAMLAIVLQNIKIKKNWFTGKNW